MFNAESIDIRQERNGLISSFRALPNLNKPQVELVYTMSEVGAA
jgi:hypothetical protein